MGNLLFSPNGRINPSEFQKGALILIVLGFLFAISPLINFQLSMILNVVGLVFIWCWVVLWVKRYHDSGKSGWMCLIPIVIWLVLSVIVSQVVTAMLTTPEMQQEMMDAMSSSGDDPGSMFSALLGASAEMAKKTALPLAISGAVVSALVAFLFNAIIKHQPEENQFGPN